MFLRHIDSYQLVDTNMSYDKLGSDICDALGDLVPLVQFKKREKHPWRSVNLSKVAG